MMNTPTAARPWSRLRAGRITASRALALAAAGALALTIAPPASPALAENAGPIAEYAFTQTEGSTVPDLAAPASAGDTTAAIVENAADSQWTGTSLRFTGGAKNGAGNWVRLPENLLAGKTSATVTTEVKIDAAMKRDYNFLWNFGNDQSNQYFFATVKDAPRTAITTASNGGEANARATANLEADRWYSLTSVLDGEAGTLSFYVDGALAGTTETALTPASIADHSLNTIGRSPWPDPLFAGEVSAFRVYDRALDAAEVEAASLADAAVNEAAIAAEAQALLDGFTVPEGDVARDRVSLPTSGGAVTWESSNPEVVAADGTVTQPALGEEPVSVTLTATTTMRGITATRQTSVLVLPSELTAQDRLQLIADRYVVPQLLTDGSQLPDAPAGLTVTVTEVSGAEYADGVLRRVAGTDGPATLTVTLASEQDPTLSVEKTFTIDLREAVETAELLAYHRTPTSELTANNADVALSMHLALNDAETGAWSPLNENYGVFFAKTSQEVPETGPDHAIMRSLKDPSVFQLADGSYGVIATRVARGGGADGTEATSALIATTNDLREYTEIGLLPLDESDGVVRPTVVFDTAADTYRVSWSTASGAERHQNFDDLIAAASGSETVGASASGRVTGSSLIPADADADTGIDEFAGGTQITVTAEAAAALQQRYGRIQNTGVEAFADITVEAGATDAAGLAAQLPQTAELGYSDGSTRSLPVVNWNLDGVDLGTPGSYEATGTIKQTGYATPFADERADPSVYRFDYNGEDRYLMIATNDIYGDNIHQQGRAFMPIRIAETISGLSDEAGGEEIHLLDRGDVDANGNVMTGCFWAPEFHEIDGKLSILFMPCYGDSPNMMTGRASIMQLGQNEAGEHLDPADPANWSLPVPVTRADGSALNAISGISLDMTYFTDATGQAYYAWQQVCVTFIAKVDPANPTRLTSEPVRIIAPEYSWDNTCAEGPNVHERDGKLYMIYSGSSVGDTYTTGLAIADAAGSDLTDPASWHKLNAPLQKSGLFEGEWQLGTGHGMWSEDEDGNLIYVFHARTDHNGLSGRDMFVRRVHFDVEGIPVLDMESAEEVANPAVSVRIVVSEAGAGGGADAGGGAGAGGSGEAAAGGSNGGTGATQGAASGLQGSAPGHSGLASTGGGELQWVLTAAFVLAAIGAGALLYPRRGMGRRS